MITQDQLEALSKQVFITDYLLNGLFPCQSDVIRLLRSKKRKWDFNDKFEYRMLLANTNTGGTLNSQVFKETVGLRKPGSLEYGTYHATYGTVSDGFDVDMTANLETEEKKAAFVSDYATRLHSLRNNVAALFKNFAIHGRFGVVHQIRSTIDAPSISAGRNPQPNVFTPEVGVPFTIKTPINVFNSNFKTGKYLIKTTEAAPWGAANVAELYMVLDNQPCTLSLLPCGTVVSAWEDGQFLEVAHCDSSADFLQSYDLCCSQSLLSLQLLTLVGDFSCLALVVHYVDVVTCLRRSVESEHQCWLRWACLLDSLVSLVEHGLHLSEVLAGYHYVAHFQRSVADEHC